MPLSETQVSPRPAGLIGATPAPLLWRVVALVLDCTLAGLVAGLILTRLILPQDFPDASTVVRTQVTSIKAEFDRAQSSNVWPKYVFDDKFLGVVEDTGKTFFLTMLVYFVAGELATGGGTLGKKAFGLRAARLGTGEVPGIIEIISRNLFKVASFFLLWPIMLLANALPAFVRPARRAGHDYLARTVVTRDPPPPEAEETHHEE